MNLLSKFQIKTRHKLLIIILGNLMIGLASYQWQISSLWQQYKVNKQNLLTQEILLKKQQDQLKMLEQEQKPEKPTMVNSISGEQLMKQITHLAQHQHLIIKSLKSADGFQVSLQGNYQNICQWLKAFINLPIQINQFSLMADHQSPPLLSLDLVINLVKA